MMHISILTLFPEMFSGPFEHSIVKHAAKKNLVEITLVNIRTFGIGFHRVVDDKPYGGGVGMIMRVDVLDKAIKETRNKALSKSEEKVVLLDPRGKVFNQSLAKKFSTLTHLILVCGHYEGIDERVRSLVDETVSIGDYILTGGEIPAMIVTDSVTRLIKGVLKKDATNKESFSEDNMLEYPQYTKPRIYNNQLVPEILLSGNHKAIEEWKKMQTINITNLHRPELSRPHKTKTNFIRK